MEENIFIVGTVFAIMGTLTQGSLGPLNLFSSTQHQHGNNYDDYNYNYSSTHHAKYNEI